MKASQMVARVPMVREERVAALQRSGDLYECEWHDGDFYGDRMCVCKGPEGKENESSIKRKGEAKE